MAKNRIIGQKLGFSGEKLDFMANDWILWQKIGFYGEKSDFMEKNRILWRKIGYFSKGFYAKLSIFEPRNPI